MYCDPYHGEVMRDNERLTAAPRAVFCAAPPATSVGFMSCISSYLSYRLEMSECLQ